MPETGEGVGTLDDTETSTDQLDQLYLQIKTRLDHNHTNSLYSIIWSFEEVAALQGVSLLDFEKQ